MGRDEKQQPHGPAGLAALGAGWSHRHRDVSGGWLRPTVFGAVDGLVTNASLISGLGGGGVSAHTVVLTGVASLVAGAFSMGTGEFISVTNQNELVGAEVLLEQQMLTRFPAAEEEELAGDFRDYGADPQTAALMAAAVSRDPDTALRIHTRQELSVDPQELPSPLLAGVLIAVRVLGRSGSPAPSLSLRRIVTGTDTRADRGRADRRRHGGRPGAPACQRRGRACASSPSAPWPSPSPTW